VSTRTKGAWHVRATIRQLVRISQRGWDWLAIRSRVRVRSRLDLSDERRAIIVWHDPVTIERDSDLATLNSSR
jgi:hypothetical protein